jgi:hypothetical protein
VCEYELSDRVNVPPSPLFTAQYQSLPAHAVEPQSTALAREERLLRQCAMSTIRASKHKKEDRTSQDRQERNSTASEGSISNVTRTLDPCQSSPGNCIVSPIPSLCRAHARALTITSTSGLLCLEEKGLRGGGNVQNAYNDTSSEDAQDENGKRSFRSHESPFTRSVKEKLRQAHAYNEESPRKLSGGSDRVPETSGKKFKSPSRVWTFSVLDPLRTPAVA